MMKSSFRNILLVEDEALIAMDAEECLQMAGHKVIDIARTVKDAMRILHDHEVDVALLDFHLPDGTSTPIAHWLDEHHIPFAIVTSQSARHLTDEGLPVGRIFQKPTDYAAVVEKLAQAA